MCGPEEQSIGGRLIAPSPRASEWSKHARIHAHIIVFLYNIVPLHDHNHIHVMLYGKDNWMFWWNRPDYKDKKHISNKEDKWNQDIITYMEC